MSLLLEALKKAEKAKEDAQRRAEGGADPDAEASSAPSAPARPVMTRDQLPEISRQPLEIVSDELQLAPDPVPESSAAAPSTPSPRQGRPKPAPREARAEETESAERASARKVFEVKFREPNPKLPFYIAMGSLGVAAVGIVVYFYIQLRPPPSLVNPNPPRTTEVAAATPQAGNALPAAPAQSTPAIPGLPTGSTAVPVTPSVTPAAPRPQAVPTAPLAVSPSTAPAVPAAPRRAARAETPLLQPSAPAAEVAARPAARGGPQVHPGVAAGYAAYQSGDLAAARREYDQVLSEDSNNRDALLGMAAIEVRGGRLESAEALYLRLLQLEPRDSHAHAALVALRAGRQDPLTAESRVKTMLNADPGAHVLNFALGNQLAQQGRWREAQQEYFKAMAAEPDNPDFAYNLAVSLDHLRQPKLALEHYRRAITLAEKRGGAGFDLAAARLRMAELDK